MGQVNYNRQFYFGKMGKKMIKKGKKPNEDQTLLYDRITKIETDILSKIQKLKRLPKFTFCEHLRIQTPQAPEYDPQCNYYDQFWKLFLRNEVGKGQISKFQQQIAYLNKRLTQIQSLFQTHHLQLEPYLKYHRHYKIQSESKVQCSICFRFQSDQETLMLHKKIKHSNLDVEPSKKKEDCEIFQEQDNSVKSS